MVVDHQHVQAGIHGLLDGFDVGYAAIHGDQESGSAFGDFLDRTQIEPVSLRESRWYVVVNLQAHFFVINLTGKIENLNARGKDHRRLLNGYDLNSRYAKDHGSMRMGMNDRVDIISFFSFLYF